MDKIPYLIEKVLVLMLEVLINYCYYLPSYDYIIEKKALGIPKPLTYPKEYFLHPKLWYKKTLGRLMLIDIAKKLNPQVNTEKIEITVLGKPLIPNVFVSLSYTDDIVMIAGSIHGNIGIDIEKNYPVDLSLYQNHFTVKELNYINHSTNVSGAFYEIWTKKESILKADGRGFTIDPLLVDVSGESVKLPNRNEKWSFLPIKLTDKYIGTLSANTIPTKIIMKEIFPDSIEVE